MKIYHYLENGMYAGESVLDESDVDPISKKQGEEVYLIPGNATSIAPPTLSANQKAVYNGVEWGVEDVIPPPPQPSDLVKGRNELLSSLVHEFSDGRQIQVRPAPFSSDESNIRNAIEQMLREGENSRAWFMADNTVANVSVSELQEALISGKDQGKVIWDNFLLSVANAV